jgi:hypothetical protein
LTKRLVFPAIYLRTVLPQLLQIKGGEVVGREVDLMLGVISKVKATNCPVKQIILIVRLIPC